MIPRAGRRLVWLGTTVYNGVRSWCPERVKLNDDEDDNDSKLLRTHDLEMNRRGDGVDEKDDSDFASDVSRDWADKKQLLSDLQSLIIILQQKHNKEWRWRNWPLIATLIASFGTLVASSYGLNREIGKLNGMFNQYQNTIAFNSTLPCPVAYPQWPADTYNFAELCYIKDQWMPDETFVENCKSILIAYCKHMTAGYEIYDAVAAIAFMCALGGMIFPGVWWLLRDDKNPLLTDLPVDVRTQINTVDGKIIALDPADYLGVKPGDTIEKTLLQFKDQAASMKKEIQRATFFARNRRVGVVLRSERVQPSVAAEFRSF